MEWADGWRSHFVLFGFRGSLREFVYDNSSKRRLVESRHDDCVRRCNGSTGRRLGSSRRVSRVKTQSAGTAHSPGSSARMRQRTLWLGWQWLPDSPGTNAWCPDPPVTRAWAPCSMHARGLGCRLTVRRFLFIASGRTLPRGEVGASGHDGDVASDAGASA